MKYASRNALLEDIEKEWSALWEILDAIQIDDLPAHQLVGYEPRNETVDPNSAPSVDWTIRETLAHVHGWHLLLIAWLKATEQRNTPDLPAAGFNWRQTKALNRTIANDLANFHYKQLRRKLKSSHRNVMKRIEPMTEDQLMKRGQFSWTGNNALAGYIGPNMGGHYRWAQKKLKAILKNA